jgi:hypothetical protein
MNESSLHRKLKYQYAGKGGKTEVCAGEYVADGRRKDGEYIEVQTGSFGPLKDKVKELAASGSVRIIHPVAVKKIIEVYKPGNRGVLCGGSLLYRRKSPLKGSQWDIFDALLSAPLLPLIRGLSIEVVLVDILEKRIKDGKGSWRRKGISLYDKELAACHNSVFLNKPADYLRFIPFKKKEKFTSSLLAEREGINANTARKALYVLTKMGVVKRKGKKGNAWVYAIK